MTFGEIYLLKLKASRKLDDTTFKTVDSLYGFMPELSRKKINWQKTNCLRNLNTKLNKNNSS